MFDKYFCKKFHAKEITLSMLLDNYMIDSALGLLFTSVVVVYGFLDMYTKLGAVYVVGAITLAILGTYCGVLHRITVATCPLKK